MRRIYPLIFILFVSVFAFGQQTKDTLTLPEKFDKIYRVSTSYQEYKVISKERFQNLKTQVSDSLTFLKSSISRQETSLEKKADSIKELKEVFNILSSELQQTITEKNSMKLVGFSVNKGTYNLVLWTLIIVLSALVIYFFYRFKNSNIVTKKAKFDLFEVEEEFAIHKKKSLEREQKLRRDLQDEINKQRGV